MPGPNFITATELAQLRAEQDLLIGEIGTTGTIKRPTYTSNGRGGYTETFATVASNVPLRLWISSGPNGTSEEAKFWGEQELAQTDAFVVMNYNQDINEKDVIDTIGRTWRVVGIQFDDAFLTAKRLRVESMR
jgi:head-tail adaptor